MASRKSIKYLIFSITLSFITMGCGSSTLRSDLSENGRKVGLLNLVINKVEPSNQENIASLEKIALSAFDYSVGQFKSIPQWQLVDLSRYSRHPMLRTFHEIKRESMAEPYLFELLEDDELPLYHKQTLQLLENAEDAEDGRYETAKKMAVRKSIEEIQSIIDQTINGFIATKNGPSLPYVILRPEGPDFQEAHRMAAQKILQVKIGKLAKSLKLDAIGVIQIELQAEADDDAAIAAITANGQARTGGILRVGATMLMIGQDGKAAVDFGKIDIDSVEEIEGLPLFIGQNENNKQLSLSDPSSNLELSIEAAVQATIRNLIESLKEEF